MLDYTQILKMLSITASANDSNILAAALVAKPAFLQIQRDEVILYPGIKGDALYVLCEGNAAAYSADADRQVLLRTFEPYEIFGISNLFTNQPFATRIVAKTECSLLVLPKAFLTYLIDHDSNVRYQYIAFLAQKTLYLNQKISYLTAGTAEQRLAHWLDANAENDMVLMQIPMNALCTMLDIGRASLYRAFDKLEHDGFVKRDGKTVLLYRRNEMLSFYH